ncbi:MAG: hypothetical protein MK081_14010 [Flavobacteriales bacterium]|nr:hypothetical protein [Flavobacteriales bacterium]
MSGQLGINFFDTTDLGDELPKAIEQATKQDAMILDEFKKRPEQLLSPWDVTDILGNIPITSVRRSFNTLTKRGELCKTEVQKKGPYGRPSYCWMLRS